MFKSLGCVQKANQAYCFLLVWYIADIFEINITAVMALNCAHKELYVVSIILTSGLVPLVPRFTNKLEKNNQSSYERSILVSLISV